MTVYFAVIAALVDLGEEIAADSADIEGDRLIGSGSIAIRYGAPAALKVSASIFTAVILLSFIPFILSRLPYIYLIPIIIMDAAIGYSTIKLLKTEGEGRRKYIRSIYLGAALGLVIFLIMMILTPPL